MEPQTYRRMAEIQENHWWYEGRRKILASVIGRLGLPARADILEVGCGPGANLNMLKVFGIVTGVEPDDFSIIHARNVSGCRVEKGILPDGLMVRGPFDMIGAFDVIEHVDEDLESLKAIKDLLRTGGHAVFTVPAYQFLWSQHDVVNHHKRRYILPRFRELLTNAGFEVTFISYYNTLLFPLIAAVRMLKKFLKIEDVPDEAMPRLPFINTVLREIFAFERYMLKSRPLPFGVSIIAVCRKP